MNKPILTVVGVLILFCFHINAQSKKAADVESPPLLTAAASTLYAPSDSLRTDDIDLEAPVEQYIPGFPRGPKGGMPTVGHLLIHRAGALQPLSRVR